MVGVLVIGVPHSRSSIPGTPLRPEPEHADRPWLRVLAVILLVLDLWLVPWGSLVRAETWAFGPWLPVLVAGAGIGLLMSANACWQLSRRRPRTPESTVWPLHMLVGTLVIFSAFLW